MEVIGIGGKIDQAGWSAFLGTSCNLTTFKKLTIFTVPQKRIRDSSGVQIFNIIAEIVLTFYIKKKYY